MWYILVFASILLAVTSYIKWKTAARRRRRTDESLVTKLLANEAAVFFSCSLALVFIALSILLSQPGLATLRPQVLANETAWKQLVAQQLAAQLATSIEGNGKILLIDWKPVGKTEDPYHQAIKDGLSKGFAGKAEIAAEVFLELPAEVKPKNLQAADETLTPSSTQFAQWLSEHQECNIVVSFVGVPSDYPQSMMVYRAQSGDLTVGIYSGNVYQLGYPITSKGITACVAPKYSYVEEGIAPDLAHPQDSFNNRYLMITPENIKEVFGENRRMFKAQRTVF